VREAVNGGDLDAARIAHEAVGKLLAGDSAPSAPVVDLARERVKRRRS
jgi:hypothetical protein